MPSPLPEPDPNWALFLDFDGTLAEIAPTPDSVAVNGRLPALLARLQRALQGAVVIVSGRPLDQIDRYLAPTRLRAAGLHGWQMRAAVDAEPALPETPEGLGRIRSALRAFADKTDGIRLEDKGVSLALHFRAAPDRGPDCRAAAERAAASANDYEVLDGKMVVEVKPAACDKGRAIETFLAEPDFAGRKPIFAGDDRTDEHGFETVNRLGGISIRVGGARPTAAQHRIETVDAFRDWLDKVADGLDKDNDKA